MVAETRDVYLTPTNSSERSETTRYRTVHRLSMGCGHGSPDDARQRKRRIWVLSADHRRVLALCVDSPPAHDKSCRNGAGLEASFGGGEESAESQDR